MQTHSPILRDPLPRLRLLDPRHQETARDNPIADAVNIPLTELRERTHELPPKKLPVLIAGPEDIAQSACRLLAELGREATIEREWRHCETPPPGRLWEPNRFLSEILPQLRGGRALDLACGTGRDSVYLAAHGWDVLGIDILPDAVERARDLARRSGATVEFAIGDLEDPTFKIEKSKFDLIFSAFYLHRALLNEMEQHIAPAGAIVIETFTTLHREAHGRPQSDEHVLNPGELPTLFPTLIAVRYEEGWHEGRHTARLWARLGQDS